MTCANPPVGNVACDGSRWLLHRGQPMPCPSCWAAAGYEVLTPSQRVALRRWHILLTVVTRDALFIADADAAAFDDACEQLRALGVTDRVRDAWCEWLRREGAPTVEVAA